MVELYIADVGDLPDPIEQPELIAALPKERQQKIEKQKQPLKRRQSLGAGQLLAEVCKRHGISVREIRLGEHGKPKIEGLHFNLSHSGHLVICAVGNKAVGSDVEEVKQAPEHVAERYFCEGERAYLQAFEGAEFDEAFVRLWTMKESYMKMTGEGMSLPLDAFEILVLNEEMRVKRGGELQPCFIKEYKMPGYRIAVCSEEAEFGTPIYV